MRTQFRPAVALVVILLSASACTSADDGPTQSPVPGSPTPATSPPNASGTASPSLPGGTATLPDDLRTRPAVAAAIADTAGRQGVDPAAVIVAAWSPVTWNDGSLGCPAEGMAYTQATVEGELLMLRVGSGLYQYHARSGGPFAYCASPTAGYRVGG